MRERVHHPAGMRELLQVLKVPRDDRTSFKRHIKSLVASGDLIHIRGHRFGLPEKMDLYVGRLQTHAGGYGFVIPERPVEGGGDIYISGPLLNDAMHGDRVVARLERIKEGGRVEGRIIRILERANSTIVGTLPSQVAAGTVSAIVVAAVGPPLRDAVWPVNTSVVDVPDEVVSVTFAV